MFSSIYVRRKLLLICLPSILLLQTAVVVLQRREVYLIKQVFSSKSESGWYPSRNETKKGQILTFLKNFVQDKDEEISLFSTKISQNNKKHLFFSSDNTRVVKVKVTGCREIKKSNLNIFFIESRCGTKKSSKTHGSSTTFNLSPRQCCSIESAAKMNPSRNVYILHTCPLAADFDLHLPEYARNILGLENVFVVPLNVSDALVGTPVTRLYRMKKLEKSLYPIEHTSDILRLAVLWRFGGTYFDLDILSIRSLDELRSNFCGLESSKYINNAVLNFEPTGYGHELLTKILRQVNTRFNGQEWAANGPKLITNTMLQECNATEGTLSQCTVFRVYNQTVLYPLPWMDPIDFFNASLGDDLVNTLKDTGFTVHFWKKLTSQGTIQVGSSQVYGLLADEFCPEVYRNCGDKF